MIILPLSILKEDLILIRVESLIHKVHDYEGTVNEMTGDGVMALFGAPIALEDTPQRAIRSAYAIHREMARFSDKLKQEREGITALKMRVGIHTGPVVVGTLGNDLRVEFKAVGDTVNLASRMEGLAESGTTYVTEDTFKLTEGLFRFEALGEKQVKGKEEPVKVYRVIAPNTQRTRFDVSAERGLTPFVGRERELELFLDGFERSTLGRGQAFSIVSEAGIGKSRLLYEFRKAVANEDVTFLEGKCLSYSRSVAYHSVIDILKSTFDIQEGDGDFGIKEKIKRGLKVLAADEKSTLPYLLELLSVKDSGINDFSMSPEAKEDRIIGAVKRIVLKGSEIRPLIMAIEDLHWSDKSTEDSLRDLLEGITGARVFLIFTYRPEFVHTWGGKSYHSQLNLNRLSNRESLAMVTHLLGTEDIDRDLEDLILEKTEGVAGVLASLDEAIQVGKAADIPVHVSHLQVNEPWNGVTASQILERIENARQEGLDMTGDIHVYNIGMSNLNYRLPTEYKSATGIKEEYKTPEGRMEVKAAIEEVFEYLGSERIRIFSYEPNPTYNLKFLDQLPDLPGNECKTPSDCYVDLVSKDPEDPAPDAYFYEIKGAVMRDIIPQDHIFMASDGFASSEDRDAIIHPRTYDNFVKVLTQFVLSEKDRFMDLPSAIMKMTSLPANKFKIRERGRIAEGYFADIAVINLKKLASHATFEDARHYSEGVEYLLVNGVLVIDNGKATDQRAGKLLRRV